MYNIVLIGCGHMGMVHLDDIYTMDNVNIFAVVDTDIERAEKFAKKYNADNFGTDYHKFVADEKTDIVICATYPHSHLEILKECVKYKKHLLCEKPITPDLESAKEFMDIVKNSDIKVQVGYILRFNETYRKVAELIQSGTLGSPLIIRMSHNQHIMNWEKYGALMADTSPVIDCGVHYFDLIRWFTGEEIVEVSGISSTIDEKTPENSYNYGLATMKLSGGSVAFYEAGWGNTIASAHINEFIGPKGRIAVTEREYRIGCQEEGDLISHFDYETNTYNTINVNCKRRPMGKQLERLIEMIEKDVKAFPDNDDVLKSFETAIKAHKAIQN